jgi:hypothetical protein
MVVRAGADNADDREPEIPAWRNCAPSVHMRVQCTIRLS